jgi:hypothetical protein
MIHGARTTVTAACGAARLAVGVVPIPCNRSGHRWHGSWPALLHRRSGLPQRRPCPHTRQNAAFRCGWNSREPSVKRIREGSASSRERLQ